MKKIVLIASAFVLMVPVLVLAQSSEGYYDRSYVRLSYVKGDVYVQRGQDLGYEQAEVNLVVIEGDKIGTNAGRVEIQLGRRNYLRLNDNTRVDIVNLPSRTGEATKLHLLSGSVYLRIASLDQEKDFEIHTPDASFYILEEGLYRADVLENRETEFSVYSGSAEAAGEEGSALVGNRERITAANGGFTSEPVSLYSRGDDFQDWNEIRDALYARRPSRTYLQADYYDYEYELADYGRWVYEGSYGYVWVPTVATYDWRPYYHGRWVWYPIIGWTWVSYEPWGWCTSHYGRWGWRGGLGWYWIPRHHWHWGPAWVHWYHGYDYIGWCPLSYYNYPGVIINNFFYDRYTQNYFPNNSRTLTVVHKNQLQNRRLSQVALSDTARNKLGKISLQSTQPNLRPSVNRVNTIATEAKRVISRENLRSVGKSFAPGGKTLTQKEIRSSGLARSSESGATGARKVLGDRSRESDSQRAIRPSDKNAIPRLSSPRKESASSENSTRKIIPRDSIERNTGGESPPGIRYFPSRSSESATSRRDTPARVIKERSSSNNSSSFSVPRKSLPPERESERRTYSVPSRSSSSVPSRNTTAPSSGSRAPQRILSSPSRSANPPTRSFSAPSRSSGSSSKNTGAPSRSFSPTSRGSSAPSRSSSSSARSFSSPQKSSSSSSRPPSSSSASGGRIRKKD